MTRDVQHEYLSVYHPTKSNPIPGPVHLRVPHVWWHALSRDSAPLRLEQLLKNLVQHRPCCSDSFRSLLLIKWWIRPHPIARPHQDGATQHNHSHHSHHHLHRRYLYPHLYPDLEQVRLLKLRRIMANWNNLSYGPLLKARHTSQRHTSQRHTSQRHTSHRTPEHPSAFYPAHPHFTRLPSSVGFPAQQPTTSQVITILFI